MFSPDFSSGKYLVQLLFLIFSFQGNSQNLITNSSFEEINQCYGQPAGIGFDVFEWAGCTGWSNPIGASSDLWCENPIIGNNVPPQLGSNYQNPRTGENMGAILVNDGVVKNYREYIQNEMLEMLENGVVYQIKFYISSNGYDCYSNQFGVKFFSSKYNDNNQLWLTDLSPDATNDETLFSNDTSIWQKIEMQYLANGTEKFVVIGNFQDSLSMTYTLPCDTSFWGNLTLGGGYFFIDDVSIEALPAYAEVPNVFTPNNDGVNDFILPKVFNTKQWEMTIMNRWGNRIAVLNEQNLSWDGKDCDEGIYFYSIKANDKSIGQGFISLFRN